MGSRDYHVLSVSIGTFVCRYCSFALNYRVCGRHPYVANDERRLLEIIRSQKLRFDSEKFKTLTPEGFNLI